ncbi:MAG: hypothetical protein ACHQK9_18175 [Reyranellales bacterium]
MPMIASLIKIAVLAAALMCVGAVKPVSDTGAIQATREPTAQRMHCRIYFGCVPVAAVGAGAAQQ